MRMQRGGAVFATSSKSLHISGSCIFDSQVPVELNVSTHMPLCHSVTLQAKSGALSIDLNGTSLFLQESALSNAAVEDLSQVLLATTELCVLCRHDVSHVIFWSHCIEL